MSLSQENFFDPAAKAFIPYRIGKLWGFSNIWGEIQITPQYDEVDFFYCVDAFDPQYRAIVRKEKHYHIIDKENRIYYTSDQEITLIESMTTYCFHAIHKDDKRGIFFKDHILIPLIYDEINGSYEDVFIASKNGKYGRIDYQGNMIIPVQYDEIHEIEDDEQQVIQQWKAILNDKVTYYTRSISEAITTDDVFAEVFKGGIKTLPFDEELSYIYADNGKMGIEILKRNKNIPPIYDHIRPMDLSGRISHEVVEVLKNNHIFIVKQQGKYGMIDENQNILLPIDLDHIRIHSFELYFITRNGKTGVFDLKDNTSISPQYDHIEHWIHLIELNEQHYFKVFNVTDQGKKGYVGENNLRYYED